MLCEHCRQNPATAILTQTVNGRAVTRHLCAECAYLSGFTGLFGGFPFGEALGGASRAVGGKRCPFCGASLDEIAESGRIGCAECYRTFGRELSPILQNIHGKATHVGKRPKHAQKELPAAALAQLRLAVQSAEAREDFEAAARLRDEIHRLAGDSPDA